MIRWVAVYPIFSLPEGSFTNDLTIAIEQAIDGMKSQVRHAYIVGVRVDKGDRDSTSQILDDSALFPGKPSPSSFDLIPNRRMFYLPHPLGFYLVTHLSGSTFPG